MMNMTGISKLMSLVLRHKPGVLNIVVDGHGWTDVATLIERINARQPFDRAMLEEIVRTDNKQRYAFSPDGTRIRANQGHSLPVDLELLPKTPPEVLWHGTGTKFVESIERQGLKRMGRQYVHLSADPETAVTVGRRHGKPALFMLDTARMIADGLEFYQAENGVWLTNPVPPRYLTLAPIKSDR